jgi:hypothetical protein
MNSEYMNAIKSNIHENIEIAVKKEITENKQEQIKEIIKLKSTFLYSNEQKN